MSFNVAVTLARSLKPPYRPPVTHAVFSRVASFLIWRLNAESSRGGTLSSFPSSLFTSASSLLPFSAQITLHIDSEKVWCLKRIASVWTVWPLSWITMLSAYSHGDQPHLYTDDTEKGNWRSNMDLRPRKIFSLVRRWIWIYRRPSCQRLSRRFMGMPNTNHSLVGQIERHCINTHTHLSDHSFDVWLNVVRPVVYIYIYTYFRSK